MSQIKTITKAITNFRDERDWEQFHNAKDLAIALNVEAGELLELFLWKGVEEADQDAISEELADVLNYSFLIAEKYGLDIEKIMLDKIQSNANKYPVDKAKGSAKKYSDF